MEPNQLCVSQLCGVGAWRTADIGTTKGRVMSDGPLGLRQMTRQGTVPSTAYPSMSLMAAGFDPDAMYQLGRQLGAAACNQGIDVVLAPSINLQRSPLCGRFFESFSEDPLVTAELAISYIKGIQSTGVGAVLKHFAVNNREANRYQVSSDLGQRPLYELYLRAFEQVLQEAEPAALMVSYNMVNGRFVSENHELLTELVRSRWNYQGLIMSDWGGVYDWEKALMAGVDLAMPQMGLDQQASLAAAIAANPAVAERAAEAKARIEAFNARWHGHDSCVVTGATVEHETAVGLAAQGLTLLKNDGLLPLAPSRQVAVVGPLALRPHLQGGGSSRVVARQLMTPLAALRERFDVRYAEGMPTPGMREAALQVAQAATATVVCVGDPTTGDRENADRADMQLPEAQLALVEALSRVTDKLVVVVQSGGPVELPFIDQVQAVVWMGLGGEGGAEALADALSGVTNFSGHLPFSWPRRFTDLPLSATYGIQVYHEPHPEGIFMGMHTQDLTGIAPLFTFGHGLAYTQFAYTDLTVSKTAPHDVTVQLTVTNTGTRAGSTVAQVYARNLASQQPMVSKQLVAFRRLTLAAGASETLDFTISVSRLAWYRSAEEDDWWDDWWFDDGMYRFMAGESYAKTPLAASIEVISGAPGLHAWVWLRDVYVYHPYAKRFFTEMRSALTAMGHGRLAHLAATHELPLDDLAVKRFLALPVSALLDQGVTQEQLNRALEE